jgi:hypothetical protein
MRPDSLAAQGGGSEVRIICAASRDRLRKGEVYLPLDRETQAAMGGLPLHPRQSIGPIDDLMREQIGAYFSQYQDAKRKVDSHVKEVGIQAAMEVIDRFVTYVDNMPPRILDHVARVRPMIIGLIAEVQSKGA